MSNLSLEEQARFCLSQGQYSKAETLFLGYRFYEYGGDDQLFSPPVFYSMNITDPEELEIFLLF